MWTNIFVLFEVVLDWLLKIILEGGGGGVNSWRGPCLFFIYSKGKSFSNIIFYLLITSHHINGL